MEKEKKLYIPSGVEARKMLLPGYGIKEMVQSFFVALALSPIVAVVLLLTKRANYVLFSLFGIMIFSFSVCIKKDGISIFEMTKKAVSYYKTQKWYVYCAYQEYQEETE